MTAPGPDRCPRCGAAVKPGDPWCTLCYADLRPPAAPVDPPAAVAAAPTYDPLSDPLPAAPVAGPTWPCSACGTVNPIERDTCAGCGLPFLSGLREQEAPLLELPVVGDITRLGRGQRFALAGGVVLVFVLLTLVLGLLFG
jgi:hypothetical protein